MRSRPGLAALALALVAGCAGGGVRAGSSPSPTSPSPSRTGLAVTTTSHGTLPLPVEAGALSARLAAMPDRLGDARRQSPGTDHVRYKAGTAEFGIEAAEVDDLYRDDVTAAEAFEMMRSEQFETGAKTCATPPAQCLSGVSDGRRTVVWGHDDSPLVLVAVAPDAERLTLLLRAWAEAPG